MVQIRGGTQEVEKGAGLGPLAARPARIHCARGCAMGPGGLALVLDTPRGSPGRRLGALGRLKHCPLPRGSALLRRDGGGSAGRPKQGLGQGE